MTVDKKTLKIFLAIVWITGGTILMLKGYYLLRQANLLNFDMIMMSIVLIFAFLIGQIKSKYVFEKFCVKNLNRIHNIEKPKFYQFFELRFFFFLTIMILTGAFLSRIAEGNYFLLLGIGTLDIALATALLKSSTTFLKQNSVSQSYN